MARAHPLPFVLLGLMTVAAFGGPLAFGLVLRGGKSPDWPPDRPVEWWTLGGLSALVVALMVASVAVAVANQRRPGWLVRGEKAGEPDRASQH